jgi:RNA polymerase sigma-70 factor, ECF subfamily
MQDLERFYDGHVDKVYKYFYIQCLNRHVAEDLTSQTFIAYINKHNNGNIKEQTKYLYAIMRNVWADFLRIKYSEAVASLEAIEDFESHADSAITTFESLSLVERAAVYIDKLPESQRLVARLRFVNGLGLREIAQELGKTMSYVKTTQNRAIKSLKAMMKDPVVGGTDT